MSTPLRETTVLVVDLQATAANPARGEPIEIGWLETSAAAADRATAGRVEARLLRLPEGATVPRGVTRVTGLAARDLAAGHDPSLAFADLARHAATVPRPSGSVAAPAIAHYARFESTWFDARLPPAPGDARVLALVCTHAIARRLYPDLPRRGLRALTGYFGRAVAPLRRAADHVAATAFVWAHLVEALATEGVDTWPALQAWLARPSTAGPRRRVYPMPRALRLSAPAAPGVYQMLRVGGDVLYVGKAVSLRARVNSWFRKQSKVHERSLEMLAQARDMRWTVTDTGLEAALLESDEIKRLRPPYNVALVSDERERWFASPDLCSRSRGPDARHRVGPLTWWAAVDGFAALVGLLGGEGADDPRRIALATGSPPGRGPEAAVFVEGLARFAAAHGRPLWSRSPGSRAAALLALGARLWPRLHRALDDDEVAAPAAEPRTWTDQTIHAAIEEVVVRAAHASRRARWLARLSESAVLWRERASARPGETRLLVVARGQIVERTFVPAGAGVPMPPGHARPALERIGGLGGAELDRMRVLTTELRRVLGEAGPEGVTVRLGPEVLLSGPRLAGILSWI